MQVDVPSWRFYSCSLFLSSGHKRIADYEHVFCTKTLTCAHISISTYELWDTFLSKDHTHLCQSHIVQSRRNPSVNYATRLSLSILIQNKDHRFRLSGKGVAVCSACYHINLKHICIPKSQDMVNLGSKRIQQYFSLLASKPNLFDVNTRGQNSVRICVCVCVCTSDKSGISRTTYYPP